MSINNDSNNFYLNKKNIGIILNAFVQRFNLKLSNNQKTELLQTIINEMKSINNKIDRNKLSDKSDKELNMINNQLIELTIKNISDNKQKTSKNQNQNNIVISQRPVSSTNYNNYTPQKPNNFNQQNSNNYYVPVQSNFNVQQDISMSNSRKDSNGELNSKFENFIQEREQFSVGKNNGRPKTPDFSLDGSGSKKTKNIPDNKQKQVDTVNEQALLQGMNSNYDLNGKKTKHDNYNSGILQSFESENPIDMMAYNVDDGYETNINSFNTGIDLKMLEQFKEKDVNRALSEMEQLRDGKNIVIPPNKQVQEQNRQEQARQQQMQEQLRQEQQFQQQNRQLQQQQNRQLQQKQQQNNQFQQQQQNNNQFQQQQQNNQFQQKQQNDLALPDIDGSIDLTFNPINQMHNSNNELRQLQEHQQQMLSELNNLKDQLKNKSTGQYNVQEYINQINALNSEVQQYKNINNTLYSQIEELKQNNNANDANKMQLIDAKKKEIMIELSNIREEYARLEQLVKENSVVEERLESKKNEIMEIMTNYDYKIFGNDNTLCIKYSEMNKIDEKKPIYRYNLPYTLENVVQISLIEQNFNNSLFNITPYNNKLIIGNINAREEQYIDKSDNISYKYYNSNQTNYLDITIEPGNYTIDLLIEYLNIVLNKYNIEICIDSIKYIIQIKSLDDSNFKLIKNDYDIYDNLGLNVINDIGNSFKGTKVVDLKLCKQLECLITNIGNNEIKSLAKININKDKILNGTMIFKPALSKLKYLDFYFTGENNRPWWQEYNDFNFTISIKGIVTSKESYINKITIKDAQKQTNENNNLLDDISKFIN
jgi:hypothetical protein